MREQGYWIVPTVAVLLWILWERGSRVLRGSFLKYSRSVPRASGRQWRKLSGALGRLGLVALLPAAVLFSVWSSPKFGLLLCGASGASFALVLLRYRHLQRDSLEAELIPWLQGIRGLLQAGWVLSAALEQNLGEPGLLSAHLARALRQFSRGIDFEACIAHAGASGSSRVRHVFQTLLRGQQAGVGLTPVIESLLHDLEQDLELQTRVRASRASAAGQAAVAMGLPWLVFFFSRVILSRADSLPGSFWQVSFGTTLWQILGSVLAWRKSWFFSRPHRRFRRELLQLLQELAVNVRAGFDLGFAWRMARSLPLSSGPALPELIRELAGAGQRAGNRSGSRWLTLLGAQYQQGVALGPTLSAAIQTLRQEESWDLRRFSERLPSQIQVLLLVFGLLPALWILLGPLLLEISLITDS